jgi:hypothetical protein
MVNNSTHALSTSLLRARLGQVAMLPSTEQQLVERLCNGVRAMGYPHTDLVRALYIGLKLRWGICLHGAPVEQTLPVLETFAATLVGTGSEQVVKLQAPRADDAVMRRFGALRINELVGCALDPAQGSKAWLLLLHGEDAKTLLAWAQHEIAATIGVGAQRRDRWPNNLFVLAAAPSCHVRGLRHWLALRAARWTPPTTVSLQTAVPPVGYQRQMVAGRLCGSAYLHWLRGAQRASAAWGAAVPSKLVSRWLAAAVDAQGRGLWVADDPDANAQHALAALHAFVGPTAP